MTISKIKVGSTEHDLKAASADKLNTNAGSTTQPIYFADGIPKSCTYALNKSVPSNAQFTDTTYTFSTGDTNGSIKITPSSGGNAINVPVKGLHTAAYTNAADYLTKVSPTGSGSLSINRKTDTTIGDHSVALGDRCTASGSHSFAEGCLTTASGAHSHAEGLETIASAPYSHAECNNTTASGDASHAEGYETTASKDYSHAEGFRTIADSPYQHVQGKYNIVDSAETYAFIIGNGTSNTERSNALTVKWDGTVEASKNFIVKNGVSYSGYDSSGTRRPVAWFSNDANSDLVIGTNSTSSGHTGNTRIYAPNGEIILKNTTTVDAGMEVSGASAFGSTLRINGITTIDKRIQPSGDNTVQLGTSSARFMAVYCVKSAMTTSDLNAKRDLSNIDDRYIKLFDLVEPYTYYLKDGDRVHTGFISQHVEEAMKKVGLTADELGFFCKDIKVKYIYDENGNYVDEEEVCDENGNPIYTYSLRYEEYIAIIAEKIKRLEKKYNSKIEEYDNKFAELENKFAELESKFAELKQ